MATTPRCSDGDRWAKQVLLTSMDDKGDDDPSILSHALPVTWAYHGVPVHPPHAVRAWFWTQLGGLVRR